MRQLPNDICPLIAIAKIGGPIDFQAKCAKERCAWWNHDADECAIIAISKLGGASSGS